MSSFDQPLDTHKQERKQETKLSTSSPEALRVAAEITPTRLANLLIRKGPLAIRLITAQLSIEVPGFELLSLSKQRRLIMAAMEQEDPTNNVVFEKIGWGQWAVRRTGSDYIVTDNTSAYPRISVQELREKAKLGWLKKADPSSDPPGQHVSHEPSSLPDYVEHMTSEPTLHSGIQKLSSRRDSITNNKKNLHNTTVPNEKLEFNNPTLSDSELDSDQSDQDDLNDAMDTEDAAPMRGSHHFTSDLANIHRLAEIDDNAIAEDSDEDDDQGFEDPLFKFDDDEYAQSLAKSKFKRSPPLKFANRVPTKFSPPPALSGARRKLTSGTVNAVSKNTSFTNSTRQAIFSRSRLNSLENLDNYIVSSARNSSVSISSPVPTGQPNSVTSSSPLGSWTSKSDSNHHQDLHLTTENFAAAFSRRKLSFNESNIRSTLSHSLPRIQVGARNNENGSHVNLPLLLSIINNDTKMDEEGVSDTDEEDWAAMGAETLRKHSTGLSSPAGKSLKTEERTAARALVDLMGT